MDRDTRTLQSLDEIRREIDAIDADLLELLQRRFSASEKVRIAKENQGEAVGTPMRPAREADLIRKLVAARREPLPLELTVCLWRHIIASSTLLQADATVNVAGEVYDSGDMRAMLRSHFGCMPVVAHDSDVAAVEAVTRDPAAIAVLQLHGDWPRLLDHNDGDRPTVTGVLPFMATEPVPKLLIVTQAPCEPTGQDETVILSAGQLPRDFVPAPLWRARLASGEWLTSLPGYLSATEMPLVSLSHSNDELALRVLGRYPSPLAID